MNKIPVGKTIRFAYAFTFGDIGTIIGLIWIPAVLNAVVSFLALRGYDASASASGGVPPGFGLLMLSIIFGALIFAVIAVAVTQQALGLREGSTLAHFSLGNMELRVLGGFFGLFFLIVLFAVALAMASLLIALLAGMLGGKADGAAAGALASIVTLVGLGAIFYAGVRLSFLFVPSAVVDGEFGLTRSWQLTRGNFWRIVIVGLATVLPVFLLVFAAQIAVLGPEYFESIVAMMKDQAHAAKYTAEQAQLTSAKMPLLLGLGFVITPITNGLVFAPAAFAYRVLSGKGEVASAGSQ